VGVVSGGKSFEERLFGEDDSRGKELVLCILWISFIHLEKSSSCQLSPDSSKGWKSHDPLRIRAVEMSKKRRMSMLFVRL
jgi:hypothetical protein